MDTCQVPDLDKADETDLFSRFLGHLVSRLLIAVVYTLGVWLTLWVLGVPK